MRITRSYGLQQRVHKVVGLAQWLAQTDAPTIRLAEEATGQPMQVDGLHLPPAPPEPTVADLGRVLRELHDLGVP